MLRRRGAPRQVQMDQSARERKRALEHRVTQDTLAQNVAVREELARASDRAMELVSVNEGLLRREKRHQRTHEIMRATETELLRRSYANQKLVRKLMERADRLREREDVARTEFERRLAAVRVEAKASLEAERRRHAAVESGLREKLAQAEATLAAARMDKRVAEDEARQCRRCVTGMAVATGVTGGTLPYFPASVGFVPADGREKA